ncbi:MAG: hypothetical protein K5905_08170 [Roseibium sp.]|uniref:antibiotic biosynthesis monooxygenase n=1 Tax=Roseibium sp. TaxID=1936156 RepID=UPI00260E7850|nr:hypothetical protein [Roseibium sp.]MCV0425435.1 hypothetical protein [Roseibium sp.]
MNLFKNHIFSQSDTFRNCDAPLQISGTAAEEISGGSSSSEEVSWIFSVTIKEGEAANLKKLVNEISKSSKANEPNTLSYHWYISEDHMRGEVHEHYGNSEAALEHLSTFNAEYADRIMTMIKPEGMIVFGNPSNVLRQELAGANPVFMRSVAGFSRI